MSNFFFFSQFYFFSVFFPSQIEWDYMILKIQLEIYYYSNQGALTIYKTDDEFPRFKTPKDKL